MRQYLSVALVVALSAALGFVTSMTLSARPAEAQRAGFRQCFFGIQEPVDINDEGLIQRPGTSQMITVPDGWTVVGGGGTGNQRARYGTILLCR